MDRPNGPSERYASIRDALGSVLGELDELGEILAAIHVANALDAVTEQPLAGSAAGSGRG